MAIVSSQQYYVYIFFPFLVLLFSVFKRRQIIKYLSITPLLYFNHPVDEYHVIFVMTFDKVISNKLDQND